MNYMKQVAEMLGVELYEIFCTKGSLEKFKITEKGVYEVDAGYNDHSMLCELLNGTREIENQILDKKEKEYLENVLRPFKDRVVYILKRNETDGERIKIHLDYDYFSLPYFEKGTMYKGMKLDKQYKLKELELFKDE